MKRKIIKINEEKCNGCGLCARACHEGAIVMVEGKARLISDKYCDGLGDCLPVCPTGAIEIIEREAEAYDEEAVKKMVSNNEVINNVQKETIISCDYCREIPRGSSMEIAAQEKETESKKNRSKLISELRNWPIQLRLANPAAGYFQGADLLIAADCTAYAYADFHNDFIKGKVAIIACTKQEAYDYCKEKLTEIISNNNIRSITAVRMEVPCCQGIIEAVKEAMLNSRMIVPYQEIIIGINGELK